MSQDQCLLSVDIGTSSVKGCLIDNSGNILAKETFDFECEINKKQGEQSPSVWWRFFKLCVSQLLRENNLQPNAIILTGQMQSVILIENGKVVHPAIIYSDTRATKEVEDINQILGEDLLLETTKNLNDGSSVIAKLLWIKNHNSHIYQDTDYLLLGAHDYINWMLCGSRVTDYTNASTTGLLNIKSNSWAIPLLEKLDIRTDWLPELTTGYQVTGYLKKAVASELGLNEGLPIFHGAGDAASATIGSGAGEPGHFYIYLGTSGWLATTGFNEIVDPLTGIWNLRHVDPERMMYLGPMLTTAGNWEWVADTFGDLEVLNNPSEISKYAIIEKIAAESPAGSNGVIFLPMIRGERAPYRDPNARGVFYGIQSSTTRSDLYRSILEGVAFAMLSIRDVMQQNLPDNLQNFELVLTGGGAKSLLWAQIFADVMNCNVKVLSSPEDVGVKGMAIVAGKILGWHDNLIPDGSFLQFEQIFKPSLDSEKYRRCYHIYKQLYPTLKPLFKISANLLAE